MRGVRCFVRKYYTVSLTADRDCCGSVYVGLYDNDHKFAIGRASGGKLYSSNVVFTDTSPRTLPPYHNGLNWYQGAQRSGIVPEPNMRLTVSPSRSNREANGAMGEVPIHFMSAPCFNPRGSTEFGERTWHDPLNLASILRTISSVPGESSTEPQVRTYIHGRDPAMQDNRPVLDGRYEQSVSPDTSSSPCESSSSECDSRDSSCTCPSCVSPDPGKYIETRVPRSPGAVKKISHARFRILAKKNSRRKVPRSSLSNGVCASGCTSDPTHAEGKPRRVVRGKGANWVRIINCSAILLIGIRMLILCERGHS